MEKSSNFRILNLSNFSKSNRNLGCDKMSIAPLALLDNYKESGLPIFVRLGIPLPTMAEIPKPPDSYQEGLVSSVLFVVVCVIVL